MCYARHLSEMSLLFAREAVEWRIIFYLSISELELDNLSEKFSKTGFSVFLKFIRYFLREIARNILIDEGALLPWKSYLRYLVQPLVYRRNSNCMENHTQCDVLF